jgi:2,4-dienoyl-CoA reductase-like NADH-dependent reductase (Old Yellow Enzyme family)
MMKTLFDITTLNGMTLNNRFVRSATAEGMANDDLTASPRLIELMVELAKGGVGLIITGLTGVTKDGSGSALSLAIYNDTYISGLAQMTNAVHDVKGKIMIQLVHSGVQGNSQVSGEQLLGPSVFPAIRGEGPPSSAMTQADIQRVVKAFGEAGRRAKQAGFDGIQIHGAHGYLISEFLSPHFNQRTDAYGGSLKNRARFAMEVYQSVRDAVGADYPVLIKLNSDDFLEGGLTTDEVLQVAAMLEAQGIDAIELSGGTTMAMLKGNPNASWGRVEKTEVYYRDAIQRLRERVSVPLILVGGIRSYETAEQLVQDGLTDYIALSRPLIREPNLINRWQSGDTRKSECVSDNACLGPLMQGKGVQCVHVGK